jgi:hypothetical protein
LKSEKARLEAALLEFEKYGDFDCANSPVFKMPVLTVDKKAK